MTPLPVRRGAHVAPSLLFVVCALLPGLVRAQEATPKEPEPTPEQIAQERETRAHLYARYLKEELGATAGPADAPIGDVAHLPIREGMLALGPKSTQLWLEQSENFASEEDVAAICADPTTGARWTILFAWKPEGYVKDDEKDELDADAMLEAMRENEEAANEERKRRGWEALELVGWEKPPFYDERTNNLTSGMRLRGETGPESINWKTRLLGRRGYMEVVLLASPDELQGAIGVFDELLKGFEYKDGERYAQFVDGDHVAEYGLGALVVGGAGVAAAKMGLFAKLGKFLVAGWKIVLVGVIALGAVIKKIWSSMFGRDPKLDAHARAGLDARSGSGPEPRA